MSAQSTTNPANKDTKPTVAERKRIPMSVPQARLAVPDVPGYHLHWFRGEAGRIQRALAAGYEWVEEDEVSLNSRILGGTPLDKGNTDLGTRVSQVAGGDIGNDNQPVRLYLMKIKEELWRQDQKALEGEGSQLDRVRSSLLGGLIGAESQSNEDRKQTYVDPKRTKVPEFFNRKS